LYPKIERNVLLRKIKVLGSVEEGRRTTSRLMVNLKLPSSLNNMN
jgi:hypothetical protein